MSLCYIPHEQIGLYTLHKITRWFTADLSMLGDGTNSPYVVIENAN